MTGPPRKCARELGGTAGDTLTNAPECTVFTLRLIAVPGGAPAIVRLRRALKALRRSYGLRCTHASIDGSGEEVRP